MKNRLLQVTFAMLLCLICAETNFSQVQIQATVKALPDGKTQMMSLTNLTVSISKQCTRSFNFEGLITAAKTNEKEQITAFVALVDKATIGKALLNYLEKPESGEFTVLPSVYEKLKEEQIKALPTLIGKGKRVKGESFLCDEDKVLTLGSLTFQKDETETAVEEAIKQSGEEKMFNARAFVELIVRQAYQNSANDDSGFSSIFLGANYPPQVNVINRTNLTLSVTLNKKTYQVRPYKTQTIAAVTGRNAYRVLARGFNPQTGNLDLQAGFLYNWKFVIRTTTVPRRRR
jgi:hypothetical protein